MSLNHLIDHTALDLNAKIEDIETLVAEAKEYKFNSICIRPDWISSFASQYRCSAVVGFPEEVLFVTDNNSISSVKNEIGAVHQGSKIIEARQALLDGALELDPVVEVRNLCINRDGEFLGDRVRKEITGYLFLLREFMKIYDPSIPGKFYEPSSETVKEGSVDQHYKLKPIFSCEILDTAELELSVEILAETINDFVENEIEEAKEKFPELTNPQINLGFAYKNSTGFIKYAGNKPEQNPLKTTSPELISNIASLLDKYDRNNLVKIKAAGGIRTPEDALEIQNAAQGRLSHIGSSQGLALCGQTTSTSGY